MTEIVFVNLRNTRQVAIILDGSQWKGYRTMKFLFNIFQMFLFEII